MTAVSSFENLPMWYATPQNVKPGFNVLQAYKAKELCGTADTCNTNFLTVMNAGNWRVNGSSVTYALLWNPDAATRPVNSPYETSRVNVNYIKDGNGEVFIITPLVNSGTNTIIAGLEGRSGKAVTGYGQFQMPFALTVRFQ